jgi:hypothetical protein
MSNLVRGAAGAAITAALLFGAATAANAAEPVPPATGNTCEVKVAHTSRLQAVLALTCASLEPGVQARAVATVNTPRNLDDYTLSTWEGSWLQSAPGTVENVSAVRVGTIISDLRIEYLPIGG